jgi:hypothetical protein
MIIRDENADRRFRSFQVRSSLGHTCRIAASEGRGIYSGDGISFIDEAEVSSGKLIGPAFCTDPRVSFRLDQATIVSSGQARGTAPLHVLRPSQEFSCVTGKDCHGGTWTSLAGVTPWAKVPSRFRDTVLTQMKGQPF